jgi:ribosome biogenesis GTPase
MAKIFKNESKQEPIRQRDRNRRTIIKSHGKLPSGTVPGTVQSIIGNSCLVLTKEEELYHCYTAGTIISPHRESNIIAVGDNVDIALEGNIDTETELETGTIARVRKRNTKFSRQAPGKGVSEHVLASNIDKVIIQGSFANPALNLRLIDRMLVAAELGDVEPIIMINKVDDEKYMEELDFLLGYYSGMDYKIHASSLVNEINTGWLGDELKNCHTLLTGPSGVGKSTFINYVIGSEVQVVNEISERTTKGTHTTSFVKRFRLPEGGTLTDSPGIREFGIWNIKPEEIHLYFRDFEDYIHSCKYTSCKHTHEPGCAVKEAVEADEIAAERYYSYLNIYDSIPEEKY